MNEKINEYLKEIFETIESFKQYNEEGILNDTDGFDRILFQSDLVRYIKDIESGYFIYHPTEEEIDNAVDFQIMCKNMMRIISCALLRGYHMSSELVGDLFEELYDKYDRSFIINL